MKRAIILITVLTVLSLAVGISIDLFQATTAENYLRELPSIRKSVLQEDMVAAYELQSLLHANWQHDAGVMNHFISHRHTRAVSKAMYELATAIEMNWQKEALQAIDALENALTDVQSGDFYKWENFF